MDNHDTAETMSPEDAALDMLWRRTFGEPLPMMGASEIVRTILRGHGVEVPKVLVEIQRS
jgi:hypothetical protein